MDKCLLIVLVVGRIENPNDSLTQLQLQYVIPDRPNFDVQQNPYSLKTAKNQLNNIFHWIQR